MKRAFAWLLLLSMVLSGCGSRETEVETTAAETTVVTEPETEPETEPATVPTEPPVYRNP